MLLINLIELVWNCSRMFCLVLSFISSVWSEKHSQYDTDDNNVFPSVSSQKSRQILTFRKCHSMKCKWIPFLLNDYTLMVHFSTWHYFLIVNRKGFLSSLNIKSLKQPGPRALWLWAILKLPVIKENLITHRIICTQKHDIMILRTRRDVGVLAWSYLRSIVKSYLLYLFYVKNK